METCFGCKQPSSGQNITKSGYTEGMQPWVHTFNVPGLRSILPWWWLFTAETCFHECKIILTYCWLYMSCF